MGQADPNVVYVADMLVELKKIAAVRHNPMLCHLLAMAEMEARQTLLTPPNLTERNEKG